MAFRSPTYRGRRPRLVAVTAAVDAPRRAGRGHRAGRERRLSRKSTLVHERRRAAQAPRLSPARRFQLDWGQNRERLAGWLAEREWNAARVDPVHLLPGRNVIDLNAFAGVFEFEQYRWVREHLEPGGHLGHTYLWYLVDDDTFNRFLYDSRRLFPDPFASTVCPDSLAYSVQPNGSEVPSRFAGCHVRTRPRSPASPRAATPTWGSG